MCDCFHLAFPNWHAASSGTGAGRRLRGPEPGAEDDSVCEEPSQLAEGERPRPQGSSPVEEYPETYSDSDKEFDAEHDPQYKSGKKMKKSGFGSIFEKHSTPKMSKLKEAQSPESGVIVKTAKDGCAEGLVYGGGGRDGIFIKGVVPESPASKSLKLKEGDQVLSATVYFDNMSYEDAIQILEHAQAYKVKLCLKRNPDAAEPEPVNQSDVIHEEEPGTPEMREQRKSKRRSDARISWPKFSSLGRGRKSHFTRSHSSSEADEQRKLELSPTTSDTESPIKSQDALKGKKRHKNKFSLLTKRGRISSTEEQDTDTPTAEQIGGEILQTNEVSDMTQAEGLESHSRKEQEVYTTEGAKLQGDLHLEQKDQILGQPQLDQHKAELITIDDTLKTADLDVAMRDTGNTGVKSPGEKKKKKERSELKIKILGKDKSNKKETKAKSSPKRLKTIGASIEKPDIPKPGTSLETGDLLIDINTTTTTTGKSTKSDTVEIHYPEAERNLSEGRLSKEHLPKREEIEIPGMEDMSTRSTAKVIEELNTESTGLYEENHSETVQLSIDVDRVKEAVSKLPGYKLPKMDTAGVPIPEEITVIDANAQRISVKTPTKAVHATGREETLLTKFDMISSSEMSKTTVKLPKITQSQTIIKIGAHKREDIVIPGKESKKSRAEISPKKPEKKSKKAKTKTESFEIMKPDPKIPDTGIDTARQDAMLEISRNAATTILDTSSFKKEMEGKIEGVISDVKIPEIDSIEYIDSEGGSPVKKDGTLKDVALGVNDTKLNYDIISDSSQNVPDLPDDNNVSSVNVAVPEQMIKSEKEDTEFKPEGEVYKKGAKFKLPKFGIKKSKSKGTENNVNLSMDRGTIKLPEDTSEAKISEVFQTDVITETPDAKECQEKEKNKSKFKMPKIKISMPKVQRDGEVKITGYDPNIHIGVECKNTEDVQVTRILKTRELDQVIETEADVKIEKDSTEVGLPDVDYREPIDEKDINESLLNFEIPTYKLPKFAVLTHVDENDVSKDVKVGEETKRIVQQLPVNISAPSCGASLMDVETKGGESHFKLTMQEGRIQKDDQTESISSKSKYQHELNITNRNEDESEESPSKFQMPTLNVPKFGIATTSLSVQMPDLDKKKKDESSALKEELKVDLKPPQIEMEENEGKGNIKKQDLGFDLPKVKKLDTDPGSFKEKVEVKIPEAETPPGVELKQHSADIKMESPDIQVVTKTREDSPLKFRMPTLKLPKFGIAIPTASLEVSGFDKGDKKEEESTVSKKLSKIEMEDPSVQMKTVEGKDKSKTSKFKMPSLGFSVPQVKRSDTDWSFSQKDVEVAVPEAKAEGTLPDIKIKQLDMEFPDMQTTTQATEGLPSTFKIPTLQIPKFGIATQCENDEALEEDKVENFGTVEVDIPKAELTVDMQPPEIEIKTPSTHMEAIESGHEGKGSKFKMPRLGISLPQVKKPDMDFSLSQKDVEVIVPEAKAEVTLPDVELTKPSADIEIKDQEIQITKAKEGSPLKFKMPTFKLPKFGGGTQSLSVEESGLDKVEKIGKVEVNIPEKELSVAKNPPKVEIKDSSIRMKTVETEPEGKGRPFKMPSLGFSLPQVKKPDIDLSLSNRDADMTVPETEAEVTLPDVEQPRADIKMKAPNIQITAKTKEGSPSKFKMPTFKFPKFGTGTQRTSVEVQDLDKDEKNDKVEFQATKGELSVDIEPPKIEMEAPSIQMKTLESEHEVKGNKFKIPSLGFGVSQVKKPAIDVTLSQKDVVVQEANIEETLPDVEQKQPSAEIKVRAQDTQITTGTEEGSPIKFNMPAFKLPKFGIATASASTEVPDLDNSNKNVKVEVDIPEEELTVDINLPKVKVEAASEPMKIIQSEHEEKGSKFKMPRLGISMPQVKKPDVDLNLTQKDGKVIVPEVKAEVTMPDIELKQPSVEIDKNISDIQVAAKTKEGSPSTFKMPTFKLPKFGTGTHSSKPELEEGQVEVDISDEKLTVDMKPPTVDTGEPQIQVKAVEFEHEGRGSKFKLPSLGFGVPQIKKPGIDLGLSKNNEKVAVPEAKAEVTLPDVELKQTSAEIDMKTPEVQTNAKTKEGSPLKFKMPTFKLPKFTTGTSSASMEVPDFDKGEKTGKNEVNIPEEELTGDIKPPKIKMEAPSIQMKTKESEHQGKGNKFKMPSLGFDVPRVKKPDIDLNISQKDVDVIVPAAKAEVTLPDVELKKPYAEIETKNPEIQTTTKTKEGSPSKFKMPTFKLPKFRSGSTTASVAVPDLDSGEKTGDIEVDIAEEELMVDIKPPEIEIEAFSIQMEKENKEKGNGFKMPSFGFTAPQVEKPDVDLSISLKDAEVTVQEAKAEIEIPDVELKQPTAGIAIKNPDLNVTTKSKEGSPSKFKIPTFKLPKFGVGSANASVDVPHPEEREKIQKVPVDVPEEELIVDIKPSEIEMEAPLIQIKMTEIESEEKGRRLKMPSLGFRVPQVKRPDIDLSLSQKDVEVTVGEATHEIKIPDVELKQPSAAKEIKNPDVKVATKTKEASPSKFKMPTFKLPKFGSGSATVGVDLPNPEESEKIGKVEVCVPEGELTVDIETLKIEMETPSALMKNTEIENEEKEKNFKMPSLGFKKPTIDLTLSQKDVEISVQEAKIEAALPGVELKQPSVDLKTKSTDIEITTKTKEGSPSKFKMPTLKFPKFGSDTPSAVVELPDLDKDEKIGKVEVNIPDEALTVEIEPPKIDMEASSIQIKTSESEHEKGGSKFKMPSLGFGVPQVKKPDLSLSQKDAKVIIPEAKAVINHCDAELKHPSAEIEVKPPETQITAKTHDGSPSKFKLPAFKFPKFGSGTPSVSVEVPGLDTVEKVAKAKVNIPEEELTVTIKPAKIELEAPSTQMKTTESDEEKRSKFRMPSLGFSVPQVEKPDIDLSLTPKDVEVSVPEAKAEATLPDVELQRPSADIDIKAPDIQMTTKTKEDSPSKFTIPSFTLPKFGIISGATAPDDDKGVHIDGENVDLGVTSPEANVDLKVSDVELKEPSSEIEIRSPDVKVTPKTKEGSPSKFKMPPFKLPKFGLGIGNITVKQDLDKGTKTDTAIPEEVLTVDLKSPKVDNESPKISLSDAAPDVNVSLSKEKVEVEQTDQSKKSKFSLPRFSLSRTAVKGVEAKTEEPHLDISLLRGDVKVKEPDTELKSSEHEVDEQTRSLKKELEISLDGSKLSAMEMSAGGDSLSVGVQGSNIAMPQVQGHDLDITSSKIDMDVKGPEIKNEVKLQNVNDEEPEQATLVSNKPIVEVEAKFKRPNWSFPKFSFGRSSVKNPDLNVNLETEAAGKPCEAVKELQESDAEVQGSSAAVSSEESSAVELNANLKKSKFSLPKFSFSKTSVSEVEVGAELPCVDASLKEGEVEEDGLNESQKDTESRKDDDEAVINLTETDIKTLPSGEMDLYDSEAKPKDAGGSPLKIKLPKMTLPQLGGGTIDVSLEGSECRSDLTATNKDSNVEIKRDECTTATVDSELLKSDTGPQGLGSPSKFKLPLFKMPKLSFSRTKSEEEKVFVKAESKVDPSEIKVEPKNESSPQKMTLTSLGEMLKSFDIEFDVSNFEKENHPDTSTVVNDGKPNEKHVEPQDQDTHTKPGATKSPVRTGGFKFPKFGFFTQSEPPKISEKPEPKEQNSPAEEKLDEEISPTCSIQSSDDFADISSTATSEQTALSTSSPTKAMAKYSNGSDAPGFEELQSDRITSTTWSEVISVKPNVPEKTTILSSGLSSSSEDTLKLESQKIHVVTSNIQATPEAQHAKVLTAIQVQPIGGLSLKTDIGSAASWTVEDSQSGSETFETHLVCKTSSETKETIVVTKQITHTSTLESSERITGETASSIRRLKESVHSEKMKFFDGNGE